jgi:hypothetical protein
VWDATSYHRAGAMREVATALHIDLVPLPGYSPDLMPVEALSSARMSPIITAIPPLRISAGGWPLSRPASIRTLIPSPTAFGSKIGLTLTKRNYASRFRRGLACALIVTCWLLGHGIARSASLLKVRNWNSDGEVLTWNGDRR